MKNDRIDPWVKETIKAALARVDFGKIVLNIHERKVVSIDVSDRRRENRIKGSGS